MKIKPAPAKKYAMVKPCRRGHMGMRYARTGICVQCALEASVRQKHARQREVEDAGTELNPDTGLKASPA